MMGVKFNRDKTWVGFDELFVAPDLVTRTS